MTDRPIISLATCAALPDGDPDDALLADALRARGADVAWTVWNDPAADWGRFDLVVLRSTWDYQDQRDAFLRWARGVPRLTNDAAVVAWNTDKRYLAELIDDGVPVVPTTLVEPGEPLPPATGTFVVKPTVSAGSRDTARFEPDERDAAEQLLAQIHASGRTAMVQPYVASVDERGETALVYLDGAFSHAATKGPLLLRGAGPTDGLFAPEEIAPRAPSDAERALGDRLCGLVTDRFGTPAYCRVDVVDAGDETVLLELELTEPSLFLEHGTDAAGRLADALLRRAKVPAAGA